MLQADIAVVADTDETAMPVLILMQVVGSREYEVVRR